MYSGHPDAHCSGSPWGFLRCYLSAKSEEWLFGDCLIIHGASGCIILQFPPYVWKPTCRREIAGESVCLFNVGITTTSLDALFKTRLAICGFLLNLTVKCFVQKSTFARKCNPFWNFPIVVLVFVEQGPGSPYHSPVARNSPLMSPLVGDPAGIQALNLDPSCPTVPESVLRLFLHLTFFSSESLLILEFKYLNLWSWS